MKNIKWHSEEFRGDFFDHWIDSYKGCDLFWESGWAGFRVGNLMYSCSCDRNDKEKYIEIIKKEIDKF